MTEGPPDALRARMHALLPEDVVDQWTHAWSTPRAATFRINPLRGEPDETLDMLSAAGIDSTQIDWCPEARCAPPDARSALLAGAFWTSGRIHLQSLPSIAATVALDPKPGERILDLCAAPGSKTTHIAARIGAARVDDQPRPDPAPLTANDRSQARAQRLRRVLEHMNASARVIIGPGERPALAPAGTFDRVLVDAPCSGEGRLSGCPEENDDDAAPATPRTLRRMAAMQKQLLHAAIRLTRPGGVIVYSTCALSREENEDVIARALERYGQLVSPEPLGFEPQDALPSAEVPDHPGAAAHLRRIVPRIRETVFGPLRLTEGFFLARLRRSDLPFPSLRD